MFYIVYTLKNARHDFCFALHTLHITSDMIHSTALPTLSNNIRHDLLYGIANILKIKYNSFFILLHCLNAQITPDMIQRIALLILETWFIVLHYLHSQIG